MAKTSTATKPAPETSVSAPAPMVPAMAINYDEMGLDEVEFKPSSGMAFCQILTPKDRSQPGGFFIPKDQADLVGFCPSEEWVEMEKFFGQNTEATKGYFTSKGSVVVLRRSAREVWRKMQGSNTYVGPYYTGRRDSDGNPELSECARKTKTDDSFTAIWRVALVFCDEEGNLLQEEPLKLKLNTGFGGSFIAALKATHWSASESFSAIQAERGHRVGRGSLQDGYKALSRFSFEIKARPVELSNGSSTFSCYVAARSHVVAPSDPLAGTKRVEKVSVRGGSYDVELSLVPFHKAYIAPKSPQGVRILELWEQTAEFLRPKGADASIPQIEDYVEDELTSVVMSPVHASGGAPAAFPATFGVENLSKWAAIKKRIGEFAFDDDASDRMTAAFAWVQTDAALASEMIQFGITADDVTTRMSEEWESLLANEDAPF